MLSKLKMLILLEKSNAGCNNDGVNTAFLQPAVGCQVQMQPCQSIAITDALTLPGPVYSHDNVILFTTWYRL